MSAERRANPSREASAGRDGVSTYFVGRRILDGAEVYEVTATDVQRLRSGRRHHELDWHGSSAARMELARLLLSRASERRPSRELQSRFALYFVAQLPHRGFVFDSGDVWRWLRVAGDTEAPATAAGKQPLPARLRTLFHGTGARSTDA
jgi:hypothetical protein